MDSRRGGADHPGEDYCCWLCQAEMWGHFDCQGDAELVDVPEVGRVWMGASCAKNWRRAEQEKGGHEDAKAKSD